MSRRLERILFEWLPLLGYLGLIFYLSHQPDFGEITETPLLGKPEWTLHHPVINKLVHVIEYFPGTILFYRVFAGSCRPFIVEHSLTLAPICTFLYGITDEIHQIFVPGRGFEITDIVANFVAIILSLLFIKKYLVKS